MRRALFSFLTVLCLAGVALSASQLGNWGFEPSPVDSGGPDLYGYKWKQTADPGGPSYAWRDISSVGTLVSGLGDDNYVGPFNIGFPFHYYWYDVTQYWIGSNGYIEFSQPFNAASPFPNNIPLTTLPNDFITPYMADFDFTIAGATCRRYNNSDSLIISFQALPFWSYGGNHNFEIILSRLDSSITFEYGVNTGVSGNADFLVGIENVSGTMGLKHSNDVYPSSNNAIKFYYPHTTPPTVHDMASFAAGNINSQGFFVVQGGTVNPYGRVKNVGNVAENSFQVNCTIQTVSGTVVYNQTQTITQTLAPNAELDVNFTPAWTASATGTYFFKITTTLTGDMNPNNNLMQAEMDVITVPGSMAYDDGSNEQSGGWSWTGGLGGLANHFVPPQYPATIDSIKFFVVTAGGSFSGRIIDDDGAGGIPGTILYQTTLTPPVSNSWIGAAVTQPVQITSGGFFVAWIKTDTSSTPTFGVDGTTTQPFSRQGWENTGGNTWSGFRNSETGDVMIRCYMHSGTTTPSLNVTLTPINPPIVVPAAGGSFQFSASVQRVTGPQAGFWVWARDKYPDGTYTAPTLGPVQINPPVGAIVNRIRLQNVPSTWPAGLHWYIGYANPTANTYPTVDADSFSWTKSATAGNGPEVTNAWCLGEPFPGEVMVNAPAAFRMAASPNPFNPVTAISFSLPETQQVMLNVYDVQGRLVTTLVNGLREAGNHSVSFDGSNLASGLYLYSLQAGPYSATGKMMLLK